MAREQEKTHLAPAVVQAEAHPYYPQTALKQTLARSCTALMAWFPLGHGDKALLEEPVITTLASRYGKFAAQIVLRWHTQLVHVVIPGSSQPSHITENLRIFDFTLTEAEMAQINALDKDTRYCTATEETLQGYLSFAPDFDQQP